MIVKALEWPLEGLSICIVPHSMYATFFFFIGYLISDPNDL